MIRLHGFLDLLASHGGGEIRCWELESALARDGREVRSALRAEGIVRDGPRANTVPCDGLGCAREVRELPRGEDGRRRLFGVCTRDPAACEDVEVAEHEVAQHVVSREAFALALQRALRLTPSPGAAASTPSPFSAANPGVSDVLSLGHEVAGGSPREVLLALRPSAAETRALLAERARTPPRILTPPILANLLTVRDGRIAEVLRLEVVTAPTAPEPANEPELPPPAPPSPLRSRALDGLGEITRWSDVTVYDVDEEDLIGVTFGTHLRRLSCVDFGLASIRDRRPRDVFALLKTICRGNGLFGTRAFGSRSNGKRLMSELRGAMRATFGLEGDPFEPYSFRERSWKVKFHALAAAPAVLEERKREAGQAPQPRKSRA
jgi:hypothetical protein